MAIERYIGGGKLFFSKYNGTTYEAEAEIGEITGATLSISQTYADAMSKDNGIGKKVDKVATATEATIKFTTQNLSKENMALAMFGTVTTEVFAVGATLPDGTVAAASTTLDVVKGGTVNKIEGKLRFVEVNITGTRNPVLVVEHAVITPDGDVRTYVGDNFSTVAFSGEILETANGYFKEYFIQKA